jgi:hypothetical protein
MVTVSGPGYPNLIQLASKLRDLIAETKKLVNHSRETRRLSGQLRLELQAVRQKFMRDQFSSCDTERFRP